MGGPVDRISVKWWSMSWLLSLVLAAILIRLWMYMNTYDVLPPQLINERSVDDYLVQHWDEMRERGGVADTPLIKLKTGIFVQSLQFFNSSDVNLSGYIWQRYEDGIHDHIKPDADSVGFILPEQVNSGGDIEPRLAYRYVEEGEEVIGWYFEATLKQPFDYSLYPFDHKTVWVRLWPKNFAGNVVLVPDFDAYRATGPADIFGIEKEIVLGTWDRENTYFDYKTTAYDTNFGIEGYVGQEGFPELHYNFVIKRKFQNAFIIYLLPLLLVAALLFAALLTVSNREDLSTRFGFNTSGFIGASSALFFVVVLAHIQLREQFAGAGIVYIEYFYILMYLLLVAATANTYLFSIGAPIFGRLILYKDNIIPKVAYWPLVIGCLISITLFVI